MHPKRPHAQLSEVWHLAGVLASLAELELELMGIHQRAVDWDMAHVEGG
jgi:hypothetical protein